MTITSGLGKTSLAFFLSACCVFPAPASAATGRPAGKSRSVRHRYVPREKAVDPTLGDVAEYDDPIVRAAAVEALGKYNGSVVAVDPNSLPVINRGRARAIEDDGTSTDQTAVDDQHAQRLGNILDRWRKAIKVHRIARTGADGECRTHAARLPELIGR